MSPIQYAEVYNHLHDGQTLSEKIAVIHGAIQHRVPAITRIAFALYDEKTDLLKTFIDSGTEPTPLTHYESSLQQTPTLLQLVKDHQARIIHDLAIYQEGQKKHTRRILQQGFSSSYTKPIFFRGRFFGFIFANCHEKTCFTSKTIDEIDPCLQLLAQLVFEQITTIKTLTAAVQTLIDITNHRDPETGEHLERMARYARIIALDLADLHQLSDEFVEHVFLFSPLHDVGKIAIPDAVLNKPARLTEDEFTVMKTHPTVGRHIIEKILSNFDLEQTVFSQVLINIVESHHERLDGKGYPHGLTAERIPLEARIVAVADVFDALTSVRPYKPMWENERAFAELNRLAGTALDSECIKALEGNMDQVQAIQQKFQDQIITA